MPSNKNAPQSGAYRLSTRWSLAKRSVLSGRAGDLAADSAVFIRGHRSAPSGRRRTGFGGHPIFWWTRRAAFHDILDLLGIDGFVLDERMGHCVQLVHVLCQDALRTRVISIHDRTHLLVDGARGYFSQHLVLRHRKPLKHLAMFVAVGQRAKLFRQAPLGLLVAG